jgi:integrase
LVLGTWLVLLTSPRLHPGAISRRDQTLLAGIDLESFVGFRDRALIGVMVYSFVRVNAVVGMARQDYFPQGKRWWIRLHEKGGKRHTVPPTIWRRPSSTRIWMRRNSRIPRRRCFRM